VAQTAKILQIYAVSLIVLSAIRVLVPAFYAIRNTWLPASAAGLSLTMHLFLGPALFEWKGEGLPLAKNE